MGRKAGGKITREKSKKGGQGPKERERGRGKKKGRERAIRKNKSDIGRKKE